MIESILESLNWSAPHDGLQQASPNARFWDAWRSDKTAIKAAGIRVSRDGNGTWVAEREAVYAAENRAVVVTIPGSPAPYVAAPVEIPDDTIWSDEQKAIFDFFATGSGNLVVRARAGTGKTTTIKAAFSKAPEAAMLYAVFNKKNQREAAAKISDSRVEVRTLHSLGFAFIKRVWSNAKPDDNVERARIESLCGINLPDEVRNAIEKLVGFAKNSFINPTIDDLVGLSEDRLIDAAAFEAVQDGGWTQAKLASVAHRVLAISKNRDDFNRISFNDMVWLPVANNWVKPWFDLVCIDEAQDMNLPQLAMAQGASKGRVIVVGDDRQAIYGFRGAVQNGLDLMKSELNAIELGLTTTYRCPKSVVELAAVYVPDYRAAESAPTGIIANVSREAIPATAKIGDAILSRANAPLMPICLQLLRAGVPARIEGRDVGKMLLAIIRKLKAKSVPNFISKVEAYKSRQIARVARRKNNEAQLETIEDQAATLFALAEGVASVAEIEQRCINLFQDSDNNPKPAVVLSSTHKAKGLEWDRVFILRETYLRKGRESREEENIYYVAITRAKHSLIFVAEREQEAKNQETRTA